MPAHLVVAGVGSGGSLALEAMATDPTLGALTLVDHDRLEAPNVQRHVGGIAQVGAFKTDVVRKRLLELRPELAITTHTLDITTVEGEAALREALARADAALCGIDVEPAKLAFNALCLEHGTPWTLGEVLAGGVGGLVHLYRPGSSGCYGCVHAFLGRTIQERPPQADYAALDHGLPAVTRIPASKASVAFIAAMQALETLKLLASPDHAPRGQVTVIGMTREDGVFDQPYAGETFEIPSNPSCLLCAKADDMEGAFHEAYLRLLPRGEAP